MAVRSVTRGFYAEPVSGYKGRMSGRRVFVSGIGAVTPYGLGGAAIRDGLFAGRSAIAPLRSFDASRFSTRIGGELPPIALDEHFEERELPWLSSLAAHAVIAARLALADAGLPERAPASPGGVIFGTGFGSLPESGPHFVRWTEIGDAAARPTTIPVLMLNAPAAQIALHLGLKGPSLTVSTACSSGSNAIGLAFRDIRAGRQELVLAGGGEHALTELMLLSWSRLRVLSRRNDEPERASRPFDADRDGLVLADAVVLLALESEEHLSARGGRALAELVGYGSNCGAEHLTAPDRASEVAAMRAALDDAGLAEGAIDLVLAHGTATRRNDVVEGQALREVFGDGGAFPSLAAPKSMTGHAMGASGAIGTAAGTFALVAGTVPPTINLDTPDPSCAISGFSPVATPRPLRHAMVNAFAFGGHNAVLILRR
jgi:3-oxoacyl-[acyl-carrier-protein] synthase II